MIIDWADEAVEKAEILRLIYQGRFLHSNVTLGALGLVPARTTVMHLVPRETLPEPNSQGEKYDKWLLVTGCGSGANRIFFLNKQFLYIGIYLYGKIQGNSDPRISPLPDCATEI